MKKVVFFFLALICTFNPTFAQVKNRQLNSTKIESTKDFIKKQYVLDSLRLEGYFKKNHDKPRVITTDSSYIKAFRVNEFGQLEYRTTTNVISAQTMGTDKVQAGGSLGYNLDGSNQVIGLWDVGSARDTHVEFNNTGLPRIIIMDGSPYNFHASHVAGTMVAGGVDANAKGMAFNATLKSYDFTDDLIEMENEALSNQLLLSNHSYATVAGWYWDGTQWVWANPFSSFLGHTEDYNFGYYDSVSYSWDLLANTYTNYLIVKAASNDRGNGPGASNTSSYQSTDGPYDCLPTVSVAKNILTVGAVNDIVGGYAQPSDVVLASFSSTGPADDGRIKPDLVANGVDLYSTYDANDTDYASISGTSMATPSVTGSIALINQYYQNIFGSTNYLSSDAIKALLIHTADAAGNTFGPDYQYGWGLMNTSKAIQKIDQYNQGNSFVLRSEELNEGASNTYKALATGLEEVKVTMVWNDPAQSAYINDVFTVLDNPTKMLVNDLDVKVTENGNTHYPWMLNATNPTNPATNSGKNNTDNVEGVDIGNVTNGSIVSINISHDGTLTNGSQWYSLITSGLYSNDLQVDAYEIETSNYNTNYNYFTTEIGVPDGGSSSCLTNPNNNVWFKFIATSANQNFFIITDDTATSLKNAVIILWDSDGITEINCKAATNPTDNIFIENTTLTVGNTYYLSVDNLNSGDEGQFTLYTDNSPIETVEATNPAPGTIRFNDSLSKFQGWNGTTWVDFN